MYTVSVHVCKLVSVQKILFNCWLVAVSSPNNTEICDIHFKNMWNNSYTKLQGLNREKDSLDL